MRNRLIVLALLVVMVGVVTAPEAGAQNKRVGTAAATELLIPVGARDLAMSGSTLASSSGIEALYYNPAGLGRMTSGTEAMFSTMSYIADIGVSYAAVATNFEGFGVVGFSLKTLDFGEIPLTTNEDPYGLAGKTFSPTYMTIGLTYARQITDAIAVGFGAKVVSNVIDRVSSSGIAFDFGVQYTKLLEVKGLSVGVAVKNIGPQMKFDGSGLYIPATPTEGYRPTQRYKIETAAFDLPSLLEIGLGYSGSLQENVGYLVNGSFTNDNLYQAQYRLGGEIGYGFTNELKLFGRGGFEYTDGLEEGADVWGPAFGIGLQWQTDAVRIDVDYAYRTARYFDGNQVFALKFGF